MAKKTDQKTLDLIKEVKRQKAEISALEKPKWETNCSFSYTENSANSINLHTCTSVRDLICMASFLREKEASYKATAELLGVDSPPSFTWNTFSTADWLKDFKTRIGKIQIATKKKKLEDFESRLNSIISPEMKAEMELEAIASELG